MREQALKWGSAAGLPQPQWLRDAVAVAAWCMVWIALWKLAETLTVNFAISVWYPPAAISLFLMIRYGPLVALAIFAASLQAGSAQWTGYPGHHEIFGSLGHAAVYLAAASLYRRRAGSFRFSIRPETLRSLGAAALLGAVLSSIVGNANIYAASAGQSDFGFLRLFSWALGDFFGVISLCPALLFLRTRVRWPRLGGGMTSALATPAAAVATAVALASAFALVASGSGVDFRLLSVVGVGVFSVIVAYLASPRSAVIYLSVIAAISAAWLSTEVAPDARIEFALQICTFLVASYAMVFLTMERTMARVAAMNRRLRIRALSAQRDALTRRVNAVEAEFTQLAHEFKTPLGGIIGLLHMAETGMAGGRQDDTLRNLRYIRGCAWYLKTMVDDAFDMARIASGQFKTTLAEFELGELLGDLAVIAQVKVGGELGFPDENAARGVRLRSDRVRLLQILINLLVNAHRYADRVGSVNVALEVAAQSVTIHVANACAAVTKAQLDDLLDGAHGVAENSQGLGIGLPLVGKLARGIGAQVSTAVSGGVVTISVTVARP